MFLEGLLTCAIDACPLRGKFQDLTYLCGTVNAPRVVRHPPSAYCLLGNGLE